MRRVLVAVGLRNVTFDAFPPFVPPQFGICIASEAWERAEARALRRAVFCDEQRIFGGDDRDASDAWATTIVAVDYVMGMAHRVVGTVRISETAPGLWHGSRLAIAPDYRNVYGLGSGLVYRAVTAAHGRGAQTFLAHVQAGNVAFFERLRWERLEDVTLFERPHALMRADLAAYPATSLDARTTLLKTRRAS